MSRAAQRHAVHRPVGRPAVRDALPRRPRVRLRRRRAGVLGRSLRRRQGARGRDLLPRAARHPRAPRPRRVRDLEPPGRPGGLRSHRRAAQARSCRRTSGATATRGRPPARRRGDEATPRGPRRASASSVVNGFTGSSIWHIAYAFPPVPPEMIDAASPTSPSAGSRSSTCSRRKACASRSKCIPPRSRSTSPPPSARSRRSTATRRSASTTTRATSATRASTTSSSSAASATASTTST